MWPTLPLPFDVQRANSGFGSILLRYPLVLFLEVYIHLLSPESHVNPAAVTSDVNALVFFATRAECLAANAYRGSHADTIRSVSQLCSQVATSLLQHERSLLAQTPAPHHSEPSRELGPLTGNSHSIGHGDACFWDTDLEVMMEGYGSYQRYNDV